MRLIRLFVAAAFACCAELCIPHPCWADLVSGDISGTWTIFDNPVIATGDCHVPYGLTLTINPGVRFLLPAGGSVLVDGTLSAEGSALFPVVIGPADPAAGPWRCISVSPTGQAVLSHTAVHGGGASLPSEATGMLRVEGPPAAGTQLTMSSCEISDSVSSGMFVNGGTVAASACRFLGNGGSQPTDAAIHVATGMVSLDTGPGASTIKGSYFGIYNEDIVAVDARGQWWGASSGPQQAYNVTGTGSSASDDVLFSGFVTIDPNATIGDLDWDGAVTVRDAAILLRVAGGLESATPDDIRVGDAVSNGALDLLDAVRIVRMVTGLDSLSL